MMLKKTKGCYLHTVTTATTTTTIGATEAKSEANDIKVKLFGSF